MDTRDTIQMTSARIVAQTVKTLSPAERAQAEAQLAAKKRVVFGASQQTIGYAAAGAAILIILVTAVLLMKRRRR